MVKKHQIANSKKDKLDTNWRPWKKNLSLKTEQLNQYNDDQVDKSKNAKDSNVQSSATRKSRMS